MCHCRLRGQRPALDVLLGDLERLEYHCYDSAGVALVEVGTAARVRSAGGIAMTVSPVLGKLLAKTVTVV